MLIFKHSIGHLSNYEQKAKLGERIGELSPTQGSRYI